MDLTLTNLFLVIVRFAIDSEDCKEVSLRGRRSKGKRKGIRARDRAPKFPIPLPLLTPTTHATKRLDPPLDY